MMVHMGEYNNAILTLLQATEYFPEEYEIEYRLAGLHLQLNEVEKGYFHLSNGLRLNPKNCSLVRDLFPTVWDRKAVQQYIKKHNKTE